MTGAPRLNPDVTQLTVPPIAAVQTWSRAYAGQAGPLIDLAQAVPGYPPHDELLAWLAQAASDPANAGYGAITGDAQLRATYADHVTARYGTDIQAGQTCITAGCNQAFVAAVMTVAGAGDSIVLVDPFYFNHDSSLGMLGIRSERVSCRAEEGFVPSLEAIRQALHAGVRAVVLITPNNPTGAVYPPELIADIYRLCRQRGVWLLVDETYRDFMAESNTVPHALFAEDDWRSHFIQLYSFSKSYCIPGYRLGAMVAGEKVIQQIAKVVDNLQICPPRVPQHAICQALPALAAWRENNRREIIQRAAAFKDTMAQVPSWRVSSVGAYFAYVAHPFGDQDSVTVAEDLARHHGVATLPGEFFGADQGAYLRMAFANADCDTLRTLGPRLAALS